MQNQKQLVSIIVPVYNCEQYIKECVDSLIHQTYTDLEIILINDGSKDKSAEVIQKYYCDDKRIVLINKRNEGVSATRNLGIKMAHGNYLMFVDGDDYISADCIEIALKYVQKYDLDFVLGGTQKFTSHSQNNYCIDTDDEIIIYEKDLKTFQSKVLSNGKTGDQRLDKCFTSGPVCKLIKTNIVKKVPFNVNLITGEDTLFNLDILKSVKRIGVVPSIWYYYRMNENSVTNRYNPDIVKNYETSLNMLVEKYLSDNDMAPYLVVRAIQQFHGALILCPLHNESEMKFGQKLRYIKKMLNSKPWINLFRLKYLKSFPSGVFDRILLTACSLRLTLMIYCAVKLRLKIKGLRR